MSNQRMTITQENAKYFAGKKVKFISGDVEIPVGEIETVVENETGGLRMIATEECSMAYYLPIEVELVEPIIVNRWKDVPAGARVRVLQMYKDDWYLDSKNTVFGRGSKRDQAKDVEMIFQGFFDDGDPRLKDLSGERYYCFDGEGRGKLKVEILPQTKEGSESKVITLEKRDYPELVGKRVRILASLQPPKELPCEIIIKKFFEYSNDRVYGLIQEKNGWLWLCKGTQIEVLADDEAKKQEVPVSEMAFTSPNPEVLSYTATWKNDRGALQFHSIREDLRYDHHNRDDYFVSSKGIAVISIAYPFFSMKKGEHPQISEAALFLPGLLTSKDEKLITIDQQDIFMDIVQSLEEYAKHYQKDPGHLVTITADNVDQYTGVKVEIVSIPYSIYQGVDVTGQTAIIRGNWPVTNNGFEVDENSYIGDDLVFYPAKVRIYEESNWQQRAEKAEKELSELKEKLRELSE